tara:strand:- start:1758 stop:2603 length:846 start_codon:yes stop_codon:yes gene_type:complete
MDIYVVIPVFNRLDHTKKIIKCLRSQTIYHKLKLVVVNDGSSDGTDIWLKKQLDINTINGNGYLYWGGSVNLALKKIFKFCKILDWVLLINNDVEIKENYVEYLLEIAKKNHPAAVGSIIKNHEDEIVSVGPRILTKSLEINDLLLDDSIFSNSELVKNVDALSGRGVLYSVKSLKEVKGLRSKIFPHYFSDYELSLRIKRKGYSLILSKEIVVYTDEKFELIKKERKRKSIFFKLFSKKSPSLFFSKFFFWWEASNNLERISLPLRIIVFIILPALRKAL